MNLFRDHNEQRAVAQLLVNVCKQYAFDGVVIDLWGVVKTIQGTDYFVIVVQQIGMQFILPVLLFEYTKTNFDFQQVYSRRMDWKR